MGTSQNDWQATETMLMLFADHVPSARLSYRAFVEKGTHQSRPGDIGVNRQWDDPKRQENSRS